ncbi:Na+/H+ antiporter NhaA [Ruania alba]|uniref:Na(+)/H(+) antiporter NhaA n=1 Tax=Ruania alba TaxID=648782 RepID=A0A1H5NAW1_9MICO|nr:Na+/H+ antiporter NhaA [Ruania alba]SEE98779.1 sodium/proton antiporter, NhaA family [Ruania alba]
MSNRDHESPLVEPLFGKLSAGGLRNMADTLRGESMGGLLLIIGAVLALVWANSPWQESYATIRDTVIGSESLHLDLTVGEWAADGLLAVFFFVVGVELKREIVTGELRRLSTAIVPVAAAVGGMVVPAVIYLAFNLTAANGAPHGWAIPTATDIAFAVAVLALVGKWLPASLRAFLLTLAVVDDLLAIIVIAVAYSDGLTLAWLLAAAACVALFAVLVRRGITSWYLLIPLAVLTWLAMHASGIHATIAGVALGMVAPALPLRGKAADRLPRQLSRDASVAEYFEHLWRPISSGVVVPIFALFTAGVSVDPSVLGDAWADPVLRGVALGLLIGKPIGIVGATWLISRTRHANLSPGIGWSDVLGVGALAGIGFTVSLLVAELAFGVGHERDEHAKIAVLSASVLAALIGSAILWWRGRVHRARGSSGVVDDDENAE